MKSWQKPTDKQVDRAVALLNRRAHYAHFFNTLENPFWVQPLYQKGYFQVPPAVDYGSPGKATFPRWPESRYLSRMASQAPALVSGVLMGIRDTDNIEVQEDIASAVLAIPATLSAQFVEAIKSWIESPYFGVPKLPMEIGKLVSHLAKDDETSAALELVRHLLRVTVRQRSGGASDRPAPFSLSPEPEARFGTWEYEEIVKENIPDLVRASGTEAVDLLCDLLEEAVRIKQGNLEDQSAIDFSYIWRPAVEDHPQNLEHTVTDALVSAVRDGIRTIVSDRPSEVADLVSHLENRPYCLFRRLALYVLTLCPESVPNLVEERLVSADLFDNRNVQHEYFHLCRKGFQHVSSSAQQTLLERIMNGPDRSKIARWVESDGTVATDEQIDMIVRHWRRDQLASLRDHLSENWTKEYEKLLKEFGQPEHPDFPCWSESGSGPNSPLSYETLSTMHVDEIIDFMKTWHPSPERRIEPSREGLGRAFSHVVESYPARFASNAGRFKNLDPTYVRSLLSGLDKTVRAGKAIDWSGIVDLCHWVVSQPRTKPPREWRYEDRDPNWGWTLGQIADLLEAGFNSTVSPVPFDLRHEVWGILEPITNYPDPNPEDEGSTSTEKRDPLMDSWNTTRAKALRTVINYAVWVKASVMQAKQQEACLASGLEAMPEVKRVLDEHLVRDPSLAIRSVYGQWLPWLLWIDQSWTLSNISTILPGMPELSEYWQVAWESYVKLNQVQRSVFDIMRAEYERAIGNIGSREKDHYFGDDPDDALAKHLMTVYWHGGEAIENEASLVRQFFDKASSKLRAHALFLLGRSLHKHPGDLTPELSTHMMKLWEWRLNTYQVGVEEESRRGELSAFGWWFTSGKLNLEWTLKQVKAAITICRQIENSNQVMEKLKQIAVQFPADVAECLLVLVEKTKDSWRLHYWHEDAYAALETVCQKGDEEAIHLARKAANLFGERGFRIFKTLCQGNVVH